MSSATGIIAIIFVLAFTLGTMKLATSKGRSAVEGVLLGFFLGIIGLIIELILPRKTAR